ncbi:cupredoxin domain-containing protein [Kitasatospora brasiliensis]|uniref:cupredoxin domain-containing protein n=1 Tax=Kitasatospora brasiliensis TaxID=3058040 RepID=UPI00292F289C|nr:cupredoxin domain-containing protein [Kitasatospora sp. K002]
MRRSRVRAIALTLLLAAGPALTGCVSAFMVPGPEETSGSAVAVVPPSPVADSPSPFAGTAAIRDFAFDPAGFTVSPGAVVTVTNTGTTAHTLTAQDGSFDTGPVAPGAAVSLTAPGQPGAYAYVCGFHHFMRGILTVG